MKKKWLTGGLIASLLILAIVFGSTSNYFGAFNMNRGGGEDTGDDVLIETVGLVDDDSGSNRDMSEKDQNALGTGVPYVQTVDFEGEIDFFDPTELYRFKISAIEGNITVYYIGFDFYEEGLEIEDVYITEYGKDTVLGEMTYYYREDIIYGPLDDVDDGVMILQGDDKTFSLWANLDRDHDEDGINSETRFGKATSPYCVGPDTYVNVKNEVDFDLGMIWAPRVYKDLDDPVWVNDRCDAEGLPASLFEIVRL